MLAYVSEVLLCYSLSFTYMMEITNYSNNNNMTKNGKQPIYKIRSIHWCWQNFIILSTILGDKILLMSRTKKTQEFGFRPDHGTLDQLYSFKRVLHGPWKLTQPVCICFVNLEKAFHCLFGSPVRDTLGVWSCRQLDTCPFTIGVKVWPALLASESNLFPVRDAKVAWTISHNW